MQPCRTPRLTCNYITKNRIGVTLESKSKKGIGARYQEAEGKEDRKEMGRYFIRMDGIMVG